MASMIKGSDSESMPCTTEGVNSESEGVLKHEWLACTRQGVQ